MKLQQLKIFVAAVECGTLTKASSDLFLAQSALSLRIKELEQELGVSLLNRSTSGVTPTPVGIELYQHARKLLALVEDIHQIPSDCNNKAPLVRFAATSFVGHLLLLNTFLSLREKGTDCHLYEFFSRNDRMDPDQLLVSMESDNLTFGIVNFHHYLSQKAVQRLQKRSFHVEYIGQDPFCLVVREGHPLLHRQATLPDLLRYPHAIYQHELNDYIKNVYGQEYCQENAIRIENLTGLRNYLFQTDAISVITHAELMQSNSIHRNDLHVINIPELQWYQNLYYIRPATNPSASEKLFVNQLLTIAPHLLSSL